MAARTRTRASGFAVFRQALGEAVVWGLVAHICYNKWAAIFGNGTWKYDYSIHGLVSFLIDQIVPSQWVPLMVGALVLVVLFILAYKFFPLLRAAWNRPIHTAITALIIFGITIGAFEAIYYGITNGDLYFSPNFVLNTLPALVVATVIIAGRGGKVYFQETGVRDITETEDFDE